VTSHFHVSQTRLVAWAVSAPWACIVRVTPSRSSAFSLIGTAHGSSSHGLDHDATDETTGPSSMGGPATRAEARAISAARSPARRAAAGLVSGSAWKPPRASDQGTNADSGSLLAIDLLDDAVASADELGAGVHGPRVGVAGAGIDRGLDRRGSNVIHESMLRPGAAHRPERSLE